jgi:hypothetical protein
MTEAEAFKMSEIAVVIFTALIRAEVELYHVPPSGDELKELRLNAMHHAICLFSDFKSGGLPL